jgi:hypothetical protein
MKINHKILSKENKEERLLRAKNHIFSLGLRDIGSYLCRANMKYGLAKMHWVQEQLGFEANATFISGPDETISRNVTRWKSGIGYGGKISWGDGKDKFMILDVMPNACGMLVGGLQSLPKPTEIIQKINELMTTERYIEDIVVKWDFAISNHFIDMYRVERTADVDLPPYAFIIHSGTPELRSENAKGCGLYLHRSETLKMMSQQILTPFGEMNVLLDNDAIEYMEFFSFADRFSKKKRILAAEILFDNYTEISNTLHQGLINPNEIILGTHNMKKNMNKFLPIALRADLPAYLFKGKKNFDSETIEILGFSKRARKLGVLNRLKNAYILPHGGGYTFSELLNVDQVMEINNERYFVVDMHNAIGQKILTELRNIPYNYRGREVIVKTLELNLGESVARLIPEYVLKI